MKNAELVGQIKDVLTKKNKLTAQEIAYQIEGKPAMIQVNGVLGKLKNSGEIREEVNDKIRYYSLTVEPKKESKKKSVSTERDVSRFDFDGATNLSKGRLVHAVVAKYVRDKKPSVKELKNIFPDEIAKPYGVFQVKSDALKLSPDPKRKRYFFDDADVIKIEKGKNIVTTNQWTQDRFLKFMMVATDELGYKIKTSSSR